MPTDPNPTASAPKTPLAPPLTSARGGGGGKGSLGYYPHISTKLEIHRHGFQTIPLGSMWTHQKAPQGFKRGKCTQLTPEVRQRLRSALLTQTVPGFKVLDVTLTIPGTVTPDQWRDIMKRYNMRLKRRGLAMIWRVELQKRKMPHIHAAIFAPAETANVMWAWIQIDWLESLPEENRQHQGADRHACHLKGPYSDIEQSPKWLAYLTGHASKHKKEQLGWEGKQWGMVNKSLFVERPPLLALPMTDHQEKWFKRTFSRYMQSVSRARYLRRKSKGIKATRPRRLFFRAGCRVTRIISPAIVAKLGEWAMLRI